MVTRLPEVWKTRNGRLLLIREMSDNHIKNAILMLKKGGFHSSREWKEMRPELPVGLRGEYAIYAAEDAFDAEYERWSKMRPHPAIDAFHLELAYRRRNGIIITDAQVKAAEQLDPIPPPDVPHLPGTPGLG